MDVKYNTTINITLGEDDIKELKEELFKIYGFWDKHNGEVSEKYVGTILAKLWHSL